MKVSARLAGAILITLASTSTGMALSKQPSMREQAEAACYNDAVKFCNDDIPDEAKVTACMRKNRAGLSPTCGKIFDKGLKGT